MKTLTAVTLGAVAVGGSTLAASRVPVAPDFSALPVAAQSPSLSGRPHPRQRRSHGFRASSEGPDCSCGAG